MYHPCFATSRAPQETLFHTLTASQLVAMAITDPVSTVQEIVIHNASSIAAQAIPAQAFANDVGCDLHDRVRGHGVNSRLAD